jgi:hypothetical protein
VGHQRAQKVVEGADQCRTLLRSSLLAEVAAMAEIVVVAVVVVVVVAAGPVAAAVSYRHHHHHRHRLEKAFSSLWLQMSRRWRAKRSDHGKRVRLQQKPSLLCRQLSRHPQKHGRH